MPSDKAPGESQMSDASDSQNPGNAFRSAPRNTLLNGDALDLEIFVSDNKRRSEGTTSAVLQNSPLHIDVGSSASMPDIPYQSFHDLQDSIAALQGEKRSNPPFDQYDLTGLNLGSEDREDVTATHHNQGLLLSLSRDHEIPIASTSTVGQPGFNGSIGQLRKHSPCGAEEDADPLTNHATYDASFSKNFGTSIDGAIDRSDFGARTKEEKNDPNPPWSEMKTKAGKERKRLPLACISCRRKKIRCSGEKPSCEHCLRSRIPCVYKVTTRKAAPRTDYMAMLDKRLKRMEERIIKIVPKEDQDITAANVTRATVKPEIPGTLPVRDSASKKRTADEAFGQELKNWAKSVSESNLAAKPKEASLLIQETEESKLLSEGLDVLPSKEFQEHLAEVFFENVYGQTYHLLHKPSFMRKLRAGTVPPVLILTVCAIAARFSAHPKLNQTPNFLRGEQWASEARKIVIRWYEWPNITILTCLLILGLHEFGTCQGGRSWAFGGMAIRMAYALQLHRDLEYDPLKQKGASELTFIDREIRRRTMWGCFLMDKFNSSGTDRPTFIQPESIKVQLPIKEKYFQFDMPGPTETLKGKVPNPVSPGTGQVLDAKENMGVAAYMVRSIALWARVIQYLNLGDKEDDPHPMWHPDSVYTKIMSEAEGFESTLPDDLQYTPENLYVHGSECLANQFLFLHISIQQNMLFMNRIAITAPTERRLSAEPPKEFATTAATKSFEAANKISEVLRDGESYFITAPFAGYCVFLSSTVHIFGVFSKNSVVEASSKLNLATNMKYLAKMKNYWGMFHWMIENLKEQYQFCADAARKGSAVAGAAQSPSAIVQYGEWFDRYPHGVTRSIFDDEPIGIRKERGDDAVLGEKSGLQTVEHFFDTINTPDSREVLSDMRTKGKIQKAHYEPFISNMTSQGSIHMQSSPHHIAPGYSQISPTTAISTSTYHREPAYFGQDFLVQPHQQCILSQLDRHLVFEAYAGINPSIASDQMLYNPSWDTPVAHTSGLLTEPSSVWMMPFNMDPPNIGHE